MSELLDRLAALANCTDEPGRVTRLFLSPAHARAVALVRGWMEQAGLVTTLDASASVVGTRPGPRPDSPVLLLGSHIDSVRDGGRFDGCLGVLAAIEAVQTAGALPFAVQLHAFGDEEGVRFPVTLTGARACAGDVDPAWFGARDADGITLGEALAAFGGDPEAMLAGACTARRAFAYLEVHIEQGPLLDMQELPLGIVTAISGATRLAVSVLGRAGHAGTVPMAMRHDALAAAAGMILAVREAARARPDVVATVGQLTVAPGAVNVIPGEVRLSVDLRAPDDARRAEALADMQSRFAALAEREAVTLTMRCTHTAPAVDCDASLQRLLADALQACGLPVVRLPSGAGHDAMALARLCPVGMLFVRCAGGVSHHPDESVSEADAAAAVRVLATAIRKAGALLG